jgi:hypothetical protein
LKYVRTANAFARRNATHAQYARAYEPNGTRERTEAAAGVGRGMERERAATREVTATERGRRGNEQRRRDERAGDERVTTLGA